MTPLYGLILLVVVGSSIWVGFDASGRDWSQDGFAKSATGWVVGCLLIWIIVFPLYLARRGRAPKGMTISGPSSVQDAMYRECPHCKEPMRRDATVCPHCRSESLAWTLHEGRWWYRTSPNTDWQWFDESTGEWMRPAAPQAPEPSPV